MNKISLIDRIVGTWLCAGLLIAFLGSLIFSIPASLQVTLLVAAYLCFCISIYRRASVKSTRTSAASNADLIITYASQTGFAAHLAIQTEHHFIEAGYHPILRPIEEITHAEWENMHTLILILSTSGDGDAPDHALKFVKNFLHKNNPNLNLAKLHFAMLGLGDRNYPNFCGFAHQVQHWLLSNHATPLFDMVEVDNANPDDLSHWQSMLSQFSGVSVEQAWSEDTHQNMQLIQRECLNPNSSGAPVYRIQLRPEVGTVWQAGDILEVFPPTSKPQDEDGLAIASEVKSPLYNRSERAKFEPSSSLCRGLVKRDYSIASIPAQGVIELCVRLHTQSNGELGLGSGWLCQLAEIGTRLECRLRNHPGFHLSVTNTPVIFIGNGTGIAGLMAHIRTRVQLGEKQNALFFGERHAQHDDFYAQELRSFQQQGMLAAWHSAWSRDQDDKVYVQDLLLQQSELIRTWVERGAHVLICGSLKGMAAAVHLQLQAILGEEIFTEMQESGRYRRDIY